MEAPGSITLEFPDLPALVEVVRAHPQAHPQGIVSALDNTWGAGIAFNAFDLGADISVHALTKYPSGGADVLMGSVITRVAALHQRIHFCHTRLGFGVGANDVELVLRGLPSIVLRYAAQDATTRELASWMQTLPQVERVLHPALPGSPGHEAWKRDCSAAACIFSAVFKPEFEPARIDAFCDALQLFKLGYSWAGPLSLCAPYDMPKLRQLGWPHQGGLVRFCMGLEAVADLKADIVQALPALTASR
jgi:cystathionine beta-lyase